MGANCQQALSDVMGNVRNLLSRLDAIDAGEARVYHVLGDESGRVSLRELGAQTLAAAQAAITLLLDHATASLMQAQITAYRASNAAFPDAGDLPGIMQSAQAAGDAFWPVYAAAVETGTFAFSASAVDPTTGVPVIDAPTGADIRSALAGPEFDAYRTAVAAALGA